MVDYNIVKHCGLCKVRFVVKKAEIRKHYCNVCQKKISESKKD